jgi:hypothetical protein
MRRGPQARGRMQVASQTNDNDKDDALYAEQRRVALGYIMDAFEEARLDGLDTECLAHAALFAALKDLVTTYGEEPVAQFASRLPDRIRGGEYSVQRMTN